MIITVTYCGQKEPNFTRLSMTQNNVMHQIKGTFSEDVSGKVSDWRTIFLQSYELLKNLDILLACSVGTFQTNQEQTRQMAGAQLTIRCFFAGKYCGRTLPKPVTASSQSLYIMFHSDDLVASKGFKAEWTSSVTSSAFQGELFSCDEVPYIYR